MKPIVFLGNSLEQLRDFPERARQNAGYQLDRVQRQLDPDDWKPMASVGKGVREIRVRDERRLSGDLPRNAGGGCLRAACVPEEVRANLAARSLARVHAVQDGEPWRKSMKRKRFASVWDAIETTPANAASMKARAELMTALRKTVESWGVTQVAAAKRLSVSQPRLNDLFRGRISKFSLDALIDLAARAGLSVRIAIRRAA